MGAVPMTGSGNTQSRLAFFKCVTDHRDEPWIVALHYRADLDVSHLGPQAAAPSIQMVPARDRLIGPNRGSWSRGRHSLTNRTGSGSARVVERAEEPRRSAWSIPERRRAVLTAGRRDNVTTRKGRRAGAGCCLKRNARAGSCAMPGVMRRRSGLDRRGVHGSGPNDWFRQHPKPPCVLQVRHGSS